MILGDFNEYLECTHLQLYIPADVIIKGNITGLYKSRTNWYGFYDCPRWYSLQKNYEISHRNKFFSIDECINKYLLEKDADRLYVELLKVEQNNLIKFYAPRERKSNKNYNVFYIPWITSTDKEVPNKYKHELWYWESTEGRNTHEYRVEFSYHKMHFVTLSVLADTIYEAYTRAKEILSYKIPYVQNLELTKVYIKKKC